jgi:hypothetical protein
MIIAPVTAADTAGGVALMTPVQASKCRSVVIQNAAAGNPIALKYDGGADALTFANGILIAAGATYVIDVTKGEFHNDIKAICGSGLTSTVRVHGIE